MQQRGSVLSVTALAFLACAEPAPVPVDSTARAENTPASAAHVPDSAGVLTIEGEGLRVFLVPSGSARPILFGEPRSAVLAAVTRVQQGQRPELAENVECPATVATWPVSGLQLLFTPDSGARFIGWSLGGRAPTDSGAPALTTASGIGLGSTRAALESVYVARVARSSLGVEFSAGGLAGLLASEAADAPIHHLWAGQVCLAR